MKKLLHFYKNHRNLNRDISGITAPANSFADTRFKQQLLHKVQQRVKAETDQNSYWTGINRILPLIPLTVAVVVLLFASSLIIIPGIQNGENEGVITKVLAANEEFLNTGEFPINAKNFAAGYNFTSIAINHTAGPATPKCGGYSRVQDITALFYANESGQVTYLMYHNSARTELGEEQFKLLTPQSNYHYLGGDYAIVQQFATQPSEMQDYANFLRTQVFSSLYLPRDWTSVLANEESTRTETETGVELTWKTGGWICHENGGTVSSEFYFTAVFDKRTYFPTNISIYENGITPEQLVQSTDFHIIRGNLAEDAIKTKFEFEKFFSGVEVKVVHKYELNSQESLLKSYRIISNALAGNDLEVILPTDPDLNISLQHSQIGTYMNSNVPQFLFYFLVVDPSALGPILAGQPGYDPDEQSLLTFPGYYPNEGSYLDALSSASATVRYIDTVTYGVEFNGKPELEYKVHIGKPNPDYIFPEQSINPNTNLYINGELVRVEVWKSTEPAPICDQNIFASCTETKFMTGEVKFHYHGYYYNIDIAYPEDYLSDSEASKIWQLDFDGYNTTNPAQLETLLNMLTIKN